MMRVLTAPLSGRAHWQQNENCGIENGEYKITGCKTRISLFQTENPSAFYPILKSQLKGRKLFFSPNSR
jgi:hypothetical protein